MNWLALAILSVLFSNLTGHSRPLGTFPIIEQGDSRIELEALSDLWVSPYQRKDTPMRVLQGAVKIPLVSSAKLKISFSIDGEARSLGMPDLTAGNDQVLVGPELRSESVGLALGKINDDHSSYSLFVSRESASDESFNHRRDMWWSTAGFYRTPPRDGWNWVLGFHQSANRGILNRQAIPILGFDHQVSSCLKISAGFPYLALDWTNLDKMSANVTITNVGVLGETVYQVEPDLKFLIRGGLTNRSYAHVNRIENDKRLYYEEKRFDFGFKLKLEQYISYGLLVGYSYDRKIFEGETVFSPIGPIRKDDPDFFGGFHMEYIF